MGKYAEELSAIQPAEDKTPSPENSNNTVPLESGDGYVLKTRTFTPCLLTPCRPHAVAIFCPTPFREPTCIHLEIARIQELCRKIRVFVGESGWFSNTFTTKTNPRFG